MSAAARAEARKKAILSRGSDRLAKLTTSARGDDPAYMHDDPPLPSFSAGRNLVGEESSMPMPSSRPSPSPTPRAPRAASKSPSTGPVPNPFLSPGQDPNVNTSPDPPAWSPEQQQQFMQALMNASPLSRSPEYLPGLTPTDVDPSLPPMDNPLAALLFPQSVGPDGGAGFGGAFGGAGGFPPLGPLGAPGKAPMGAAPSPPPTRLQKLMPFVHLVTMWLILAYFVLYREPRDFLQITGNVVDLGGAGLGGIWARWAELGRRSPLGDTPQFIQIQIVPFFWAFTTLQIVLHSVRIFSGFDAVQPPTILAIALPHLPAPLPSIIVNGMKYWQMGSLFLDDLSGLIVGLGFIVMFSGWLAV